MLAKSVSSPALTVTMRSSRLLAKLKSASSSQRRPSIQRASRFSVRMSGPTIASFAGVRSIS